MTRRLETVMHRLKAMLNTVLLGQISSLFTQGPQPSALFSTRTESPEHNGARSRRIAKLDVWKHPRLLLALLNLWV